MWKYKWGPMRTRIFKIAQLGKTGKENGKVNGKLQKEY